jgi:hypothetical protein
MKRGGVDHKDENMGENCSVRIDRDFSEAQMVNCVLSLLVRWLGEFRLMVI